MNHTSELETPEHLINDHTWEDWLVWSQPCSAELTGQAKEIVGWINECKRLREALAAQSQEIEKCKAANRGMQVSVDKAQRDLAAKDQEIEKLKATIVQCNTMYEQAIKIAQQDEQELRKLISRDI